MKSFINKYSTAFSLFFGCYIVLALNVDLTVSKQQMEQTIKHIPTTYSIEQVLLYLFSYMLLKRCVLFVTAKPFLDRKQWFLCSIPAALFSSFMIVGFSFKTTGNFSCIFLSKYQLFKSLFVGGGYFILFLCLIIFLFDAIDNNSFFSAETVSADFYLGYFYRHPFIISYLILFVCCIPYIIISYPAILTVDAGNQIFQSFNIQSFRPYLNLISEDVKLNNHHPVFHSLLLHSFIVFGELICSYNFGLFLFAFFQLSLLISVVSFAIMILVKRYQLKIKYALIILLFFLIHPIVQNYMMLVTKDVLFTVFLLLFLLFNFLFIEQGRLTFKQYLTWLLIMIGVVLFRNDGVYLIVPTLLYWLFLDVSKKKVGTALMIIVCFFLAWHHVVFPFFKITPGSVREMLSIPFQQTARYVKFRPQTVTQNEIVAIDAVLDYKNLRKNYNPNTSDPIKNTFRESSTNEQRLQYLKTWAGMFRKDPVLYLEAVIANKYEFIYAKGNLGGFYGYNYSGKNMKRVNGNKEIAFDFHHLKGLEKHRERYEKYRLRLFSLPGLKLLRSASTYVWALILLIFYVLKQGSKKKSFALLVPYVMYFLVLMAGPGNGSYIRYLYPYIVTFPFLFIFLMYLKDVNCN